MPTYPPSLSEALRSLQRQIDQINTARPGPMSWGPDDGHARFYGPDGTTVLFEAVGGAGASIVSRGALTGMTGLLDGIRDTDDAQNGRLNDQHGWIESLGTRMGGAEGRLDGHDTTLSSHNTRISTAQSRADKGVADASAAQSTANTGVSNAATAQSRADDAHGDAATAKARADDAYSLAADAVTPGELTSVLSGIQSTLSLVTNWINSATDQDPALPPWGGN